MDRTVSTGCLVLVGEHRREQHAQAEAQPPIYAALIREWQARGRMVPGTRDAQWDTLVTDVRAPHELPAPATGPPDGRRERTAGLMVVL
jgi:hypothetical protein